MRAKFRAGVVKECNENGIRRKTAWHSTISVKEQDNKVL
jgi:hypothetical protein